MLIIIIEKKIRWLDVGYYNRKENKMVGCWLLQSKRK